MSKPMAIFALLAGSLSLTGHADDAAQQPARTVWERHDQSGVPGKEIVIGTAVLPPGTAIGYHTHAGDESGYVVTGTLVLKTRGQPDKTLNAGDHFFNVRGAVHSVLAPADGEGGTAVSTWIVDKGVPLATPVP